MTFPQGWMASNRRCDFPEGRRYLKGDDPKLAENFACAAQVGLTGGTRSAEAVVQAVSEELNRPGGCNEGFLRDDALLLVTILHDNYELDSEGTPFAWAEALRADHRRRPREGRALLARGGDSSAQPARVFAQSVKYGRVESICEKSDVPNFAEELAALIARCEGPTIPEWSATLPGPAGSWGPCASARVEGTGLCSRKQRDDGSARTFRGRDLGECSEV